MEKEMAERPEGLDDDISVTEKVAMVGAFNKAASFFGGLGGAKEPEFRPKSKKEKEKEAAEAATAAAAAAAEESSRAVAAAQVTPVKSTPDKPAAADALVAQGSVNGTPSGILSRKPSGLSSRNGSKQNHVTLTPPAGPPVTFTSPRSGSGTGTAVPLTTDHLQTHDRHMGMSTEEARLSRHSSKGSSLFERLASSDQLDIVKEQLDGTVQAHLHHSESGRLVHSPSGISDPTLPMLQREGSKVRFGGSIVHPIDSDDEVDVAKDTVPSPTKVEEEPIESAEKTESATLVIARSPGFQEALRKAEEEEKEKKARARAVVTAPVVETKPPEVPEKKEERGLFSSLLRNRKVGADEIELTHHPQSMSKARRRSMEKIMIHKPAEREAHRYFLIAGVVGGVLALLLSVLAVVGISNYLTWQRQGSVPSFASPEMRASWISEEFTPFSFETNESQKPFSTVKINEVLTPEEHSVNKHLYHNVEFNFKTGLLDLAEVSYSAFETFKLIGGGLSREFKMLGSCVLDTEIRDPMVFSNVNIEGSLLSRVLFSAISSFTKVSIQNSLIGSLTMEHSVKVTDIRFLKTILRNHVYADLEAIGFDANTLYVYDTKVGDLALSKFSLSKSILHGLLVAEESSFINGQIQGTLLQGLKFQSGSVMTTMNIVDSNMSDLSFSGSLLMTNTAISKSFLDKIKLQGQLVVRKLKLVKSVVASIFIDDKASLQDILVRDVKVSGLRFEGEHAVVTRSKFVKSTIDALSVENKLQATAVVLRDVKLGNLDLDGILVCRECRLVSVDISNAEIGPSGRFALVSSKAKKLKWTGGIIKGSLELSNSVLTKVSISNVDFASSDVCLTLKSASTKHLVLENLKFSGSVDFQDVVLKKAVFRNVVFGGPVNFEYAALHKTLFENVTFMNEVAFDGATLKGNKWKFVKFAKRVSHRGCKDAKNMFENMTWPSESFEFKCRKRA